ncbi:MAG: hypothetical protein RR428_03795 [Coprobacillus sp.]
MKYIKMKYGLFVLLVLLVACSVCMSIYFHKSSISVIYPNDFGEDATMLLSTMYSIIEYPYPLTPLNFVLFVRSIIVIALPIVSGVLLYKQRTVKNGIYLLISGYLFFIETIKLDYVSTGIYNLFRKIHTSYYLGITDMPWLSYYLSVLIIIGVMIGLLGYEIHRHKKVGNAKEG